MEIFPWAIGQLNSIVVQKSTWFLDFVLIACVCMRLCGLMKSLNDLFYCFGIRYTWYYFFLNYYYFFNLWRIILFAKDMKVINVLFEGVPLLSRSDIFHITYDFFWSWLNGRYLQYNSNYLFNKFVNCFAWVI